MVIDKIVAEFQILYQKILDLYKADDGPVEKWTKIASYVHDHNSTIVAVFNVLKGEDSRKEISLDYKTDNLQLEKQISGEANMLVKASLIISSMHHIVYDMLSTEGNYYFSLNGQEEMAILKKPITYYINISIKNEQNVYFHAFILLFALESLFNRHFYIGIDFEYTNKKIQLAQLNFEHNVALQSIIMIVSPNELEAVMTENFINLIICNKYIKKILHGSDSLDIPYMYQHLLGGDSGKIIRFTRTLIDTRFLCEYYKLNIGGVSDNKCSIYDEEKNRSAIYYFSVISEDQQEKLTELLQSMQHHHDIVWTISKLPRSHVHYAMYDVFFLKWAYYRIIYMATLDEETDLGKKSVIELYKHVLCELTRVVYLENNDITFLLPRCKEEVDPVNNYMVRKQTGILKLIDIFNQVSTNINTVTPKVSIDKVIKVNHFKRFIMTIIKKMTYTIISRKCKVFKDRTTMWVDKLDNQYVFDFLKKMNFYHLEKMFREIEMILEDQIKTICS